MGLAKCSKCGKVQDPDENRGPFVITSGSRLSNTGDGTKNPTCVDCGEELELLTLL